VTVSLGIKQIPVNHERRARIQELQERLLVKLRHDLDKIKAAQAEFVKLWRYPEKQPEYLRLRKRRWATFIQIQSLEWRLYGRTYTYG
jgi:hypothetical protein